MNKELCFILDGVFIYNDFCLVRDDIPIFFTCKNEQGKYYVALCVDMDLPRYNVVSVKTTQLNKMLQGIISMRKIFTIQQNYWEITPVDGKIENDIVVLKSMSDIELDDLPDDEAYFELFSDELKEYAKAINRKISEGEFDHSLVDTFEILNDTNDDSKVNISISLNKISITVETCDKTEIKKNLVLQNVILPKYKKEESCLIENLNCIIESQDVVENKILVKNVKEDSSLNAA